MKIVDDTPDYSALDLALTRDRMETILDSNPETLSTDSNEKPKNNSLTILALIFAFIS